MFFKVFEKIFKSTRFVGFIKLFGKKRTTTNEEKIIVLQFSLIISALKRRLFHLKTQLLVSIVHFGADRKLIL